MQVLYSPALAFSRKRLHPQLDSVKIGVNGESLSKQESVKYFGMEVNYNLSWEKQAMKVMAAIRRASAYLPLLLLYNALVLPHLHYCSVVWHSCSKTISDKVERVQNYAMRVILQRPPRSSSEALRNVLGWATLHRCEFTMLLQVRRCLRKEAPAYLCDKFVTYSRVWLQGNQR